MKMNAKKTNCVGCANCCKTELCFLGKYIHGDATPAPCPSLRHRKGRYWCHLIETGVPSSHPLKDHEGSKVSGRKSIDFIKEKLEIGKGCPSPNNDRRKKQVFKSKMSHVAARIELGVRNGMIDGDGEWSIEAQEDRDKVQHRWEELKEEGKTFYEAIKQARLEFVESVLSEFLKEMSGGNIRTEHSRKEQQQSNGEAQIAESTS